MTKDEEKELKDAAWAHGIAQFELGSVSPDMENGARLRMEFSALIDQMTEEPKAAKTYNQFAFPSNDPTGEFAYAGMTLRDYFAAHALSYLTSKADNISSPGDAAKYAYVIADAMLVERAV